jgi:enoyl-CoA hydratase/carnithine racemase
MTDPAAEPTVTVELRGHILLMGLNRPDKRNAFNSAMLDELADAYARLEDDPEAWVGVLFAHGEHFTGGLDLAEGAGRLTSEGGLRYSSEQAIDPWGFGRERSKPLVAAAQGWCMTLGIELLLAADIRLAASEARFSQMEVNRGIYPFGGATIRLPREAGWGNAMRWLLTGDEFDAAEAHRLGLIQEVTDPGHHLDRAVEIAERISTNAAPLGVRATLRSAREGESAAAERLVPEVLELMNTEDAQEGVQSFRERRTARFVGR